MSETHVIRESGAPVHTVLVVSLPTKHRDYHNPSLMVVNGGLKKNGAVAALQLRHSWATDDEGDASYLVSMDLDSIILDTFWDGQLVFTGYLTAPPRFYPEGDPFDPNTRKDDSEDAYANYGHEYLPPVRHDFATSYPVKVRIDMYTNDAEDSLTEWVENYNNKKS